MKNEVTRYFLVECYLNAYILLIPVHFIARNNNVLLYQERIYTYNPLFWLSTYQN